MDMKTSPGLGLRTAVASLPNPLLKMGNGPQGAPGPREGPNWPTPGSHLGPVGPKGPYDDDDDDDGDNDDAADDDLDLDLDLMLMTMLMQKQI